MSKKRRLVDCNNEEERNDSVIQQGNNAGLTSESVITVQDLPNEILVCLLSEAVAMEVMDMRLIKTVWKEKVDPIISRYGTVCSQWNSIVSTEFFLLAVHRILDGTAPKPIRFEMLDKSAMPLYIDGVASMNNEIYIMYQPSLQDQSIYVYDRNKMAEIKDIIPLQRNCRKKIVGCNFSKCVYVLFGVWGCSSLFHVREDDDRKFPSICRITEDNDHHDMSPWITDLDVPSPTDISVSVSGSLILLRWHKGNPGVVSIYDANGSFQREMSLSLVISELSNIIPRSNGNFVLVSEKGGHLPKLTEINIDGSIIRQYQSSASAFCVKCADIYERILIVGLSHRMELLDSEFNVLDFTPPPWGIYTVLPDEVHFDRVRNELMKIEFDDDFGSNVISIFRLKED